MIELPEHKDRSLPCSASSTGEMDKLVEGG